MRQFQIRPCVILVVGLSIVGTSTACSSSAQSDGATSTRRVPGYRRPARVDPTTTKRLSDLIRTSGLAKSINNGHYTVNRVGTRGPSIIVLSPKGPEDLDVGGYGGQFSRDCDIILLDSPAI